MAGETITLVGSDVSMAALLSTSPDSAWANSGERKETSWLLSIHHHHLHCNRIYAGLSAGCVCKDIEGDLPVAVSGPGVSHTRHPQLQAFRSGVCQRLTPSLPYPAVLMHSSIWQIIPSPLICCSLLQTPYQSRRAWDNTDGCRRKPQGRIVRVEKGNSGLT